MKAQTFAIPLILIIVTIIFYALYAFTQKIYLEIYDIEVGFKREIIKNIDLPFVKKTIDYNVNLESTIFSVGEISFDVQGDIKIIFYTNNANIEIYKDDSIFWKGRIYNGSTVYIPNVEKNIKIVLEPGFIFEKKKLKGIIRIYETVRCLNFTVYKKANVIGLGSCTIFKDNVSYYQGVCSLSLEEGEYILCPIDEIRDLSITEELYSLEYKEIFFDEGKIYIEYDVEGNVVLCISEKCFNLIGQGVKEVTISRGYYNIKLKSDKKSYIRYLRIHS